VDCESGDVRLEITELASPVSARLAALMWILGLRKGIPDERTIPSRAKTLYASQSAFSDGWCTRTAVSIHRI
jgi:hypothetical protein